MRSANHSFPDRSPRTWSLVTVAVTLLLAFGCSDGTSDNDTDVTALPVRLLERFDAMEGGTAEAITPVVKLNPAEAVQKGWLRKGNGIPDLEVDSEEVTFRTDEASPYLDLDFEVDTAQVNVIAVTIKDESNLVRRPKIQWKRPGDEDFNRERRVLLRPRHGEPSSPGDYRTYYAAVEDSPRWEGVVSTFRIEPTTLPGASLSIRAIDFLNIPFLARRTLLEGKGGIGPFEIDSETRDGIFAAPPFRRASRIQVPPGAKFEFGFGILESSWSRAGDGVNFRVTVRDVASGNEIAAFEQFVDPKHHPSDRRWFDHRIDLAKAAARLVEIVLETSGSRGGEGSPDLRFDDAVFSNPVVYRSRVEEEMNVVFISLDTTRADRLGCYGSGLDTTPELDRFARLHTQFQNATSQAPRTLDSHMSVFTSLYPTTHGVVTDEHRLSRRFTTLAEVLREHGYHTAGFTEDGFVGATFGFQRGFDRYWEGQLKATTGGDVENTFPRATQWLRENHDKKFMMFVHTYQAHIPYCSVDPYRDLFVNGFDGSLRNGCITRKDIFRANSGETDFTPDEIAYMIGQYQGELRYMDSYLGEFLAALEELDLLDRTIVVLFADHGEEFLEHMFFGIHAHAIYQEQLHVPLICAIPRPWARSRVIETPVGLIDLAPTTLDFLGIPPPAQFQGESLLPLIRGDAAPARPVFSENHGYAIRASVRQGPFKFIHTYELSESKGEALHFYPEQAEKYQAKDTKEIFDLNADPLERTNLYESSPELAREMERLLGEFLENARKKSIPADGAQEIDVELERRLEELGYKEESPSRPESPEPSRRR